LAVGPARGETRLIESRSLSSLYRGRVCLRLRPFPFPGDGGGQKVAAAAHPVLACSLAVTLSPVRAGTGST
jgi:hypothetical protein